MREERYILPNTNYTFYAEIILNLRKDHELIENGFSQKYIVRSSSVSVQTASSHANNVVLEPESNQEEISKDKTTSVTINWKPPDVPTGELERFIIVVRNSTKSMLKIHYESRSMYKRNNF